MIEKVSKMALHADKGEKKLNTKNSHLRVGGKNSYSNRDGDRVGWLCENDEGIFSCLPA